MSLLGYLRPLLRIAQALESIRDLYKLDLESRGIPTTPYDPKARDPIEITYGPAKIIAPEPDEDY